jgi:hypothetical protein
MENRFIKILNSTLVALAFVALLVTGAALLFITLDARQAFFAQTSDQPISVTYQPVNIVSAQASGSLQGSTTPQTNDPTAAAAKKYCEALDTLYRFVSKDQFALNDKSKCETAILEQARSEFGDRAENFLSDEADYIRAVLNDDQSRARFNIPDGADLSSETDKYVDEVTTKFGQEFHAAVARDDERKATELAASIRAKTAEIALGGLAIGAFFSFLIIAFLLVAVRLERHVGVISSKVH